MADYYLKDHTRLHGQPKRTVGDYVENNGILVPRRFDSLAEARAVGIPFLARSEHPQDYDGASGIIPTLSDRNLSDTLSEEDLKRKALSDKDFGSKYNAYCALLGTDEKQFGEDISFSFWQEIDGYNRTIVADSALPHKYHIMTTKIVKPFLPNYALVEEGKLVTQYGTPLMNVLIDGLPELLELYESIRTLPHFDANHCPIMEFQTESETGKNYFLQYHRTRDFVPVSFRIERPALGNEITSLFVRGATPSEGTTFDLTVIPGRFLHKKREALTIPELEDAAFLSRWILYDETMARRRRCIFSKVRNVEDCLIPAARGHTTRSALFKPELSIIVSNNAVCSEQEFRTLWYRGKETGEDQKIKVHVVSDGRKAYIRRVD